MSARDVTASYSCSSRSAALRDTKGARLSSAKDAAAGVDGVDEGECLVKEAEKPRRHDAVRRSADATDKRRAEDLAPKELSLHAAAHRKRVSASERAAISRMSSAGSVTAAVGDDVPRGVHARRRLCGGMVLLAYSRIRYPVSTTSIYRPADWEFGTGQGWRCPRCILGLVLSRRHATS